MAESDLGDLKQMYREHIHDRKQLLLKYRRLWNAIRNNTGDIESRYLKTRIALHNSLHFGKDTSVRTYHRMCLLHHAIQFCVYLNRFPQAERYAEMLQELLPCRQEIGWRVLCAEHRGWIYSQRSAWGEASAMFLSCLDLCTDEQRGGYYHMMAVISDNAGEKHDAFLYYKKSIENRIKHSKPYTDIKSTFLGLIDTSADRPWPDDELIEIANRVILKEISVDPVDQRSTFRNWLFAILEEVDEYIEQVENHSEDQIRRAKELRRELLRRLGSVLMLSSNGSDRLTGIDYLKESVRYQIKGSLGLAGVLGTLASAYKLVNPDDYDRPLNLLQEAVEIGHRHPFSATMPPLLFRLADLLLQVGQRREALTALRQSWMIIRFRLAKPSERLRYAFIDYVKQIKSPYAKLLLDFGYHSELFQLCEEFRSLEALSTGTVAVRDIHKGRYGYTALIQEYARRKLAVENCEMCEWDETRASEVIVDTMESLSGGQLLLVYFFDPLAPFVRAMSSIDDRLYPLDVKNLENAINRSGDILQKTEEDRFRISEEDWQYVGEILAKAVFPSEVAEHVVSCKHLFICPDIGLWTVLWNLCFLDGKHLLVYKPLSFLYSVQDLFKNIDHSRSNIISGGIDYHLVNGSIMPGIVYRTDSSLLTEEANPSFPVHEFIDDGLGIGGRQSTRSCRTTRDGLVAELHCAEEEAELVAKKYDGAVSRTTFLDDDLNTWWHKAQIVHLAGHGFSEAEEPQSLAGLSSRHRRISGIEGVPPRRVSHRELVGGGTCPALIVFSSCNSGSGEEQPGLGLNNSILHLLNAGCVACISSTTPLYDRPTMILMEHFHYRLRGGCTVSEAVLSPINDFVGKMNGVNRKAICYWLGLKVFGNGSLRLNEIL